MYQYKFIVNFICMTHKDNGLEEEKWNPKNLNLIFYSQRFLITLGKTSYNNLFVMHKRIVISYLK